MISDEVRASGQDTLVNIQIDDIWRRITLTQEAIDKHLIVAGLAGVSSSEQRCEFVRGNLAYVFAAARRTLKRSPDARRITIRSGEL